MTWSFGGPDGRAKWEWTSAILTFLERPEGRRSVCSGGNAASDGLSVNVMYTVDDRKKRAEGRDVPSELGKFKFAREKSKLADTIRGWVFVMKGEYRDSLPPWRTGNRERPGGAGGRGATPLKGSGGRATR